MQVRQGPTKPKYKISDYTVSGNSAINKETFTSKMTHANSAVSAKNLSKLSPPNAPVVTLMSIAASNRFPTRNNGSVFIAKEFFWTLFLVWTKF